MKKLVAMILAAIMIMSLCGCRTNPLTAKRDISSMTPNEAVGQAMQQMRSAESFRLDAEVGFTLSAMGQTVKMNMHVTAEQTQNPERCHIQMTMNTGFETVQVESYTVKDGDDYIIYTGSPAGTWTKAESPDNQFSSDYQLDSEIDYTEVGTETVNGEVCTHYAGTISAEKLLDVIGSLEELEGLGLDLSDPNALGQSGDLTVDVWVSQSTGRLARFSVDVTPLMEGAYASLLQAVDMDLEIGDVILQYDFTGYNEIAPIEIPAEVLEAAD